MNEKGVLNFDDIIRLALRIHSEDDTFTGLGVHSLESFADLCDSMGLERSSALALVRDHPDAPEITKDYAGDLIDTAESSDV